MCFSRKLPCQTKVTILYDVCHWRLEVDDIQDLLKGREAEELRVQPLGYNSVGDTYWYFYGTRLYKDKVLDKGTHLLNGTAGNGKSRKQKNLGKFGKNKKRNRKHKHHSDEESR